MSTTETVGPVSAEWKGDESTPNFRAIGTLSSAEMRKVEPVGPAFLAFARRKRHNRTFSEDDRIQASKQVKNIEEQDADEISEDEDPAMLQRDAKDWKVCMSTSVVSTHTNFYVGPRSLRCSRSIKIPLEGNRSTD